MKILRSSIIVGILLVALLLIQALFSQTAIAAWEMNKDRPNMDYTSFWIDKDIEPFVAVKQCEDTCKEDTQCKAFTYVKAGVQGTNARCYLKKGIPSPVNNTCCISGVVKPETKADYCNNYALDAVQAYTSNINLNCGYSGARWRNDYDIHYNWCMQVPKTSADFEANARQKELNKCFVAKNDLDNDGLADFWETKLAEKHQPYFVFDSAEAHTRSFEPVILYQVYCSKRISPGQTCDDVIIKYALLWQEDGGYGPDSWCKDPHHGDNQDLKLLISLRNDISKVTKVENGKFVWPSEDYRNIQWKNSGDRPVIYLSAHKHHQYFDTSYNHKNSPISSWGCNDDVDGRGMAKYGKINNNVSAYNNVNNVGEHFAHLITDLTPLGFPGEDAWGTTSFCGGLTCDYDTSSMYSIWDNWSNYSPPSNGLCNKCRSNEKCCEPVPGKPECCEICVRRNQECP